MADTDWIQKAAEEIAACVTTSGEERDRAFELFRDIIQRHAPAQAQEPRIGRTSADNARLMRTATEGEISLIVFSPGSPGKCSYAAVDLSLDEDGFHATVGKFDPNRGFYPGSFVEITTLKELYVEWGSMLATIEAYRRPAPSRGIGLGVPGTEPTTTEEA